MNEDVASLPANWATDLDILRLSGAVIERRDDHLVVRSPANPWAHWGNFVMVTDPAADPDADHWVSTFSREFPDASWLAVGLTTTPATTSWQRHGVVIETLDVLTTDTAPRTTDAVPGYEVRPFAAGDWQRDIVRAIAENAATGAYDAEEYGAFVTRQAQTRRELADRGDAAWFGAFADGRLVADLGIVRCGRRARYQDITTDPDHRRRGLASHLLGVAGRWAGDRGCTEWVIVTEPSNDAGRVYRAAGFRPIPGGSEAYRRPRP